MPNRSFQPDAVQSQPIRKVSVGEARARENYTKGLQAHNAEMLTVPRSIDTKVTFQEQ